MGLLPAHLVSRAQGGGVVVVEGDTGNDSAGLAPDYWSDKLGVVGGSTMDLVHDPQVDKVNAG